MNRRTFLGTFAGGLFAAPLAAEGQQAGRAYKIGMLSATPAPKRAEAFERALGDLGWIEGRNIIIERRDAAGQIERLPDLAAQLVRLNVDLIVAQAGPETAAAKQATESIPIVFLGHGDPLGAGHVASLAKPGGNITGTGGFFPELAAKRLELLKETFPGLSAWPFSGMLPIRSSRPTGRPYRWLAGL